MQPREPYLDDDIPFEMTHQGGKPVKAKNEPTKVYVVGGGMAYIRMFYEAKFRGAKSVEEADVVCFTGGEDVTPSLYDEKALNTTHYNIQRDNREIEIYADAAMKRIPMVGICRGAQFLNVMNGGKLWQHVDKHGQYHDLHDYSSNKFIRVTSTHHQMMIPDKKALILAEACQSTIKLSYGKEYVRTDEKALDDCEVCFYNDTGCLCFQPHPEYSHTETHDYFMELVNDYVLEWRTV